MNNKTKNILKSIGIIFLLLTFSSLFFLIFNINKEIISDREYLIYYSVSNLILLGIFIYIYKNTITKDLSYFKKNFLKNFFISFKYWLIGLIIMYISNYIITHILNMNIASNEISVRNFINISPLLMLFNTCIYSPITEELAFRKSIKDCISNKWIYILTSGLSFGLLHIINNINSPLSLLYLIPYGAFGITFATLYYKTNNIYSTITIHAMHNTLAIIIYLLGVSL